MRQDNVDKLFDRLQGEFDTHEPGLHHKMRFMEKLQAQEQSPVKEKKQKTNWWKPLAVAASVVFVVLVTITQNTSTDVKELADVSPEMQETQDFFTTTIAKELYKIEQQASPKTQAIIDDTVQRLEILETEYNQLKVDLTQSGEDKRVIYAMIANFQNRIALLEDVLERIETIQSLNENLTPSEI